MKIIEQTATELKIQTRGVFDFWLPSCLLMVFGLKLAAFDYHLASLYCHRVQGTQGNCQLVRSSLLGSKIQEIQLASLQGAKVVRAAYTSKVVLRTDAGYVPFTANSPNWGTQDAIASDINSFVKNAERRFLELKLLDSSFLGIGAIFVTAGIAVIAFGKKEIYSFDTTLNALTVKQQGLLGTKLIQYSLCEIYGVEVDRTKDREHDIWYEVRLLVCGGSRISLPRTMNPYQQEKIAKAINNYLHQQNNPK
ncbi:MULTISPECIES: hypothetical protein [unclassified Microcoleus]|uniref:hypothetical protein n=1 Tax=unclassified Microcoleus TaxID=2642155 RepID=UPI002FD1486B